MSLRRQVTPEFRSVYARLMIAFGLSFLVPSNVSLSQDREGADLVRKMIQAGQRFENDIITLEATTTLVEGTKQVRREQFCFMDTDMDDRGKLKYATRVLSRNPGEPHLPDEWITDQFIIWDGSVKKVYTRASVIHPTMLLRYSAYGFATYGYGEIGNCPLSTYFIGDALSPKYSRMGAYFAGVLDYFDYVATASADVLGVQCRVVTIAPKGAKPLGARFIMQDYPHLCLKMTTLVNGQEKTIFEVTELGEKGSKLMPLRAYEIPAEAIGDPPLNGKGARSHIDFKVIECRPVDPVGLDSWLTKIPSGTRVFRKAGTTEHEVIPFTAEEINAFRKATSTVAPGGFFAKVMADWRIYMNLALFAVICLCGIILWRRAK